MRSLPSRNIASTAVVVFSVLALAGCGSTVPDTGGDSGLGQLAQGGSAGSGLSVPGAGDANAAVPGVQPLPGSSQPQAGEGSEAGTTGAAANTPGPIGGDDTGGDPSATDEVRVAILHLNGGNGVINAAFPGSSVSFGDGKREAQAVIDDVNAHGGINGRKLKPFFGEIQATDGDAERGAACQGLVQDARPMVILSMFNVGEGLVACATKANIPLLTVAAGAGDDYLNKIAKNISFTPTQISRDLEQRLVLGLAHAQGKLSQETVVGVVSQSDDPVFERVVEGTIEPLLESWGVPYVKATLSSATDNSGISNAVLKFKSSNVSKVVFSLGSGGVPDALFMQNAETQLFRPSYLMGDSTGTNFVAGTAPEQQAQNIWGAGTYPLVNVAASQYPTTSREKHCLAVENASFGGQYKDRATSLTSTMYCELIYGYTHIAKTVTGTLDATSWVNAYRGIGTAYPAITTFGSNLTAARNDNASMYRELAWSNACSCITYTSPARRIPGI